MKNSVLLLRSKSGGKMLILFNWFVKYHCVEWIFWDLAPFVRRSLYSNPGVVTSNRISDTGESLVRIKRQQRHIGLDLSSWAMDIIRVWGNQIGTESVQCNSLRADCHWRCNTGGEAHAFPVVERYERARSPDLFLVPDSTLTSRMFSLLAGLNLAGLTSSILKIAGNNSRKNQSMSYSDLDILIFSVKSLASPACSGD